MLTGETLGAINSGKIVFEVDIIVQNICESASYVVTNEVNTFSVVTFCRQYNNS